MNRKKTAPVDASKPDWERIEREYRAGILTVRELGAQVGVTHSAIVQRAKRHGWSRDLRMRINSRADELLSKAAAEAVAAEGGNKTVTVTTKLTKDQQKAEHDAVETGAAAIVAVRLAHRKEIGRARKLHMQIIGQLEAVTQGVPELRSVVIRLLAASAKGESKGDGARIGKAVLDAIDLESRVNMIDKAASCLTKLVALEREAFGLDKDVQPNEAMQTLRGIMQRINGAGTGLPPVA